MAVLLVEGIITANEATFVQLGKFTPVSILGLISILLCGSLMARRVKGDKKRGGNLHHAGCRLLLF
ncbi:hypothetical protein [Segatella sp.]|uniref:hypothetical protein n=1 Tax=Segatella sp. TaxID=2974253 RepID=UPI00307A9CE1